MREIEKKIHVLWEKQNWRSLGSEEQVGLLAIQGQGDVWAQGSTKAMSKSELYISQGLDWCPWLLMISKDMPFPEA